MKKNKTIYWILTLLFVLPTAGSGIPEFFTEGPGMVVQTLHQLGYPPYLMKILALAKLLGALAILTGKYRVLKEWAYAGFAFLFLGATASHILAGDLPHAPAPFVMLLIMFGSYYYWKADVGGPKA